MRDRQLEWSSVSGKIEAIVHLIDQGEIELKGQDRSNVKVNDRSNLKVIDRLMQQ